MTYRSCRARSSQLAPQDRVKARPGGPAARVLGPKKLSEVGITMHHKKHNDALCTPRERAMGRTIKNPMTGRCIKPYGPTAGLEVVAARRIGHRPRPSHACPGFEFCRGTKAQVYHGTAYQTGGGLKRHDLTKNPQGRIVSVHARAAALRRPMHPAMIAHQIPRRR